MSRYLKNHRDAVYELRSRVDGCPNPSCNVCRRIEEAEGILLATFERLEVLLGERPKRETFTREEILRVIREKK